ncbi:MAG: TatD family hydrolase, partial [Chloroflexales bacterium]|nr:TatD family hydrolase [Chloroflexales bacterium]
LSPHPQRSRRNEPARVRLLAERLATLRDASLDSIGVALWQNAANLFWKMK